MIGRIINGYKCFSTGRSNNDTPNSFGSRHIYSIAKRMAEVYIFEQHDKVNKKNAKVACFSLIGLFFILVGYFIPTISETGDFWIFTLSNKGWIAGLIFFLLVVLLVIIGILIANKWVSRKYS
jgi:hypothetical protein